MRVEIPETMGVGKYQSTTQSLYHMQTGDA